MPDSDAHLVELLGAQPPESVRALSSDGRAALAELIADARRRQARSLQSSFEATVKYVPFPMRRLVKKVLLG